MAHGLVTHANQTGTPESAQPLFLANPEMASLALLSSQVSKNSDSNHSKHVSFRRQSHEEAVRVIVCGRRTGEADRKRLIVPELWSQSRATTPNLLGVFLDSMGLYLLQLAGSVLQFTCACNTKRDPGTVTQMENRA